MVSGSQMAANTNANNRTTNVTARRLGLIDRRARVILESVTNDK